MSGYDLYVFCLCFIVFTLLTGLFSVMLYYIIKSTIKAISHGLEDERITTEYKKQKKESPIINWISRIVCTVFLLVFLCLTTASVYIQLSDGKVKGSNVVPKVVLSDSMSFKNKQNEYLKLNDLNDQFDTFDIIFTRKLPDEFELKLYDIVVYDYHGELIVHRIVEIEEPNEEHPDKRHFLLQGDAVGYPDEFPVLYEQMKSIYKGEHIHYVGSFFAFMQSPAGYLCILLVIFAVIATPIAEKKLMNAKIERLTEIGVIGDSEEYEDNETGEEEKETVGVR